MNIMVAGQAGPYPERLLGLLAQGNNLFYCTMPAPVSAWNADEFALTDIPRYILDPATVNSAVPRIFEHRQIDIVYALKNVWDGSLELTDAILDATSTPVVRHYKEHFLKPSDLERRNLVDTAAQIYINKESYAYFRQAYGVSPATAHILDADYLPNQFDGHSSDQKLFDVTGDPHVVVAGSVSVVGRTDIRDLCRTLSRARIHVHIYGRKYIGPREDGSWRKGNLDVQREYEKLASDPYIHLHDAIHASDFSKEWSKYDVGIMHVSTSYPGHAPFQSLNIPNRLGSYLAAGLPIAQQIGGQLAMVNLIKKEKFGFTYETFDDLVSVLRDRSYLEELSKAVLEKRSSHTAEAATRKLDEIFRAVI